MWSIFAAMLPSVHGVIGLRQIDGMAHRAPLVRTDASKPGSRSAPPPSADPLAELTGLLVRTQLGQPAGEVTSRAQGVGVVLAQDAAAWRQLVRQPHFVTFAAFPLVKAVYLLES